MMLTNRRVVVSGASRGIGRALVLRLIEAGAQVACGARAEAELAALAEAGAEVHPLDVRDPASVEAFSSAVLQGGPVDALVNNAGVGTFGPIETFKVEDWDRIMETNVRGTFLLTQAFLGSLTSREGQVVNVTSDVSGRTFAGAAAYTASKHAQRAFTRALQMETVDAGVRVTEIRSGVVTTYFNDGTPRDPDDGALSADDVSEAIVFALMQPKHVRVDEVLLHPRKQPVEF